MLRTQEAKCLHSCLPQNDPVKIQVLHTHCFLIFTRAAEATDNVRDRNIFGCLKNQLKRIFGGIWRYSCTFSNSAWCSGLVWWLDRAKATQSQVSPRPYLSREHLRGRRARGGGISRRFDSYCSLKWAAQPNAGHSFPTPAQSAAALAPVKGLPKHLPSIKS